MELQTTVVDGVEYVLVPKTLVSEEKPQQPQPEAPTIGLEGFLPEETPVDASFPQIVGEPEEEIQVVDPSALSGVGQATSKPYLYREKFLKHELLPHDVMTFPTVRLNQFTEMKEIAAADYGNRIPPGKWGFYGPGIEADVIY